VNAIDKIWNDEKEKVNHALIEYLDMEINRVGRLGAWHIEYFENIKEYMTSGGKRLRPILVAIGYKSIKENVEIKHLYRAACSVEILHNGSLLHDDLIDHDESRRGGKTFHIIYQDKLKKISTEERAQDYGMTMAILGGDSLINMGGTIISASELEPEIAAKCLELYQIAFRGLVDGVLLEMEMVNFPTTTPEVYLEMVSLKTAILFEKSLVMGAIMAKAEESQIKALGTFGVKVGQAFQMQDDILGSFGDESVTGKPADGDIHEGKKTMLVIQAQLLGNSEQKKELDCLIGKPDMTKAEVDQVRDLFRKTGALDKTQEIMETLLQEGQSALVTVDPPLNQVQKEFLLALSEFLTKRAL